METTTSTALSVHLKRDHKLTSEEYYLKYIRRDEAPTCLQCNKPVKFQSIFKGYRNYCSTKCSAIASESLKQQKCMEKYGVRKPLQFKQFLDKSKETLLQHYGVTSPGKSEEIRNRRKETNLKRFGVENPLQCRRIREKIKLTSTKKYGVPCTLQSAESCRKKLETWQDKLGVTNPSQNNGVKERKKQTSLQHFGVEHPWSSQEVRKRAEEKRIVRFRICVENLLKSLHLEMCEEYSGARSEISVKCLLCNKEYRTSYFIIQQGYGRCPDCYPKYKSIAESEILNYIKTFGFNTLENNRGIIKPLELDIFISEKSLAIEYNGLYFHSEILLKNPKNYHLNKLDLCQSRNITLIQIFEDEWGLHRDIVKARLKQTLGVNDSKRIHARSCIIKEIPSNLKNEFLNKYHLQGTDSSPVSLGAFLETN